MPLSHPIVSISVGKPAGVEYRAFDLTLPGAAEAIGMALLAELPDAEAGQTFTLQVAVYDLTNSPAV